MKHLKFLTTLCCLLALTSTLFGCAMISGKNKPTVNSALLEPQANFKFSDIPVPAGFKLLSKDSYCFESSGVRVGVLKYRGKANIDNVVNFYKEQMQMYSWNLLNVVEYGQRLMNFDRDNETCNIGLEPKGSGTKITISVGPKSQIPKKPAKPVK
jgi:hypothetical protein